MKGEGNMASDREYLAYVLDQLSELKDVRWRAMMGEYILYYRDKVVGGIYDNRLLVKPVPPAVEMMPDAPRECPYEGAKEMLLVEELDNREFMVRLLQAMYEALPVPKKKKSSKRA